MSAESVLAGEGRWAVVEGDCVEVLRDLPDSSVDSVVCDPPYGLEFMGKDWDSLGVEAPTGHDKRGVNDPEKVMGFQDGSGGNAFSRSRVRMGKAENAGPAMQAWHLRWAEEAFRVLKPGGHLLAFGGTRTYHRLACAIEDAGFEVRDSVTWIYGQGFPKSLDVSKAIDKAAGAEREPTGRPKPGHEGFADRGNLSSVQSLKGTLGGEGGFARPWMDDPEKVEAYHQETAPATPEAAEWEGWGTAIKPAHEPIVVARKPLEGTVAENVLEHGTGALNIGASRISHSEPCKEMRAQTDKDVMSGDGKVQQGGRHKDVLELKPEGRWPANVMLSHTEFCALVGTRKVKGITGTKSGSWRKGHQYSGGWKGAPEDELGDPVGHADAEGNEVVEDWRCVAACPVAQLDAQSGESQSRVGRPRGAGPGDGWGMTATGSEYADRGGASRFFYQGKAAGDERWMWCADCDAVAPRTAHAERNPDCPLHGDNPETADFGPLFGGGGGACSCPRTVRDEHKGHAVEMHPTQKPLDLMLWLVRLVTPPGGVVLDPFVGSGTTVQAALRGGFRAVGVERHPAYARIARARVSAEFSDGRGGGQA